MDSEVVREANLSAANLHRAHLNGAFLENVELSGADLTEASVESAKLTGVDFARADLGKASLAGSQFRDVGLKETRLEGTILRGIVAPTWPARTRDKDKITGGDLRRVIRLLKDIFGDGFKAPCRSSPADRSHRSRLSRRPGPAGRADTPRMTSQRKDKPEFTPGQKVALGELRQLADTHPDSITVVGKAVRDGGGGLQILVRLSTNDFAVINRGYPFPMTTRMSWSASQGRSPGNRRRRW